MNMPASLSGIRLGDVQRRIPLEPLETRILLCQALGLSRTQLITQSERVLTDAEARALSKLFERRIIGEPIAYITGMREFYGLDFQVTPDVLIPRPDTELLVELALEHLPNGGRVLDLGTGSGAIAVALAHARPDAEVTAVDVSSAALAVAQGNAARILAGLGAKVRFLQSDWYAGLDNHEHFDLIVSNPPYIAAGDIHLSQGDLRFEPVNALTDQSDGLTAYRAIVSGAIGRLNGGGWLLMEHGYDQAVAVRNLLKCHEFMRDQTWRDLAGLERVSGGQRQE